MPKLIYLETLPKLPSTLRPGVESLQVVVPSLCTFGAYLCAVAAVLQYSGSTFRFLSPDTNMIDSLMPDLPQLHHFSQSSPDIWPSSVQIANLVHSKAVVVPSESFFSRLRVCPFHSSFGEP